MLLHKKRTGTKKHLSPIVFNLFLTTALARAQNRLGVAKNYFTTRAETRVVKNH